MSERNIIALDTSCSQLSVAARKAGGPVCKAALEGYYQHAESALPLIDRVFQEAGFGLAETTDFLINRGPGSFTGLRVGFATLKALRINSSFETSGALSVDLIARNVPAAGSLAVCVDARRDKVFTRQYQEHNGLWTPSTELEIVSISEMEKSLPAEITICGDGIKRYENEFKASSKNFKLSDQSLWYPKAESLIKIFDQQKELFLKALSTPDDLIPYYFRLSDPEEKREKNAVDR